MKLFCRLFASENPLDSLHARNNVPDSRRVLGILEMDIDRSAAASVMLHIAVASGGDRFSDRDSLPGADLLEIPALAFGIHSMVRRCEKCRVGGGLHRLAEEIVQARQVFFRFGRLGSPHVHWIVRGVDVEDANIRASLEDVDGGFISQ